MTPEEKKAKIAEKNRRYREANREKLAERKRRHYEANKEKEAERTRRYRKANKEKVAEKMRRYNESNKEERTEKSRQYREANKEKVKEQLRRYREANKEKVAEKSRRISRRKSFAKEDGSSFTAWTQSVNIPTKTYEAIANLTPDEGQTLAELIHELSGYAMEVCEQIANPPIEAETEALTPEPTADLF